MNFLLSWVFPVLWFLGALTLTWILGVACYSFIHWLGNVFPELLAVLEVIVAFGIICSTAKTFPFGLAPIMVVSVICGLGAFIERIVFPSESRWTVVFLRQLLTTTCNIALVVALALCVLFVPKAISFLPALSDESMIAFAWGIGIGALCSPSIIPLFILVGRSLKMHPGMDKHLD